MTRQNFNQGWAFRPAASAFHQLAGAGTSDWTDITLPHDALIATERQPDVPGGETNGYFAGGAFQYLKTFAVAESDRGNRIALEFGGVYRHAMVYVNGTLAGQDAFGYSPFAVRIDPHLNFGTNNELRVECRTHLDSRWYAGAGIYRDVFLVNQHPAHLASAGVRISTIALDRDQAVVEIAAQAENTGGWTVTATLDATVLDPAGEIVGTATSPITLFPNDSATSRLRLSIADPALWNVDSPALYAVQLELRISDEIADEQTQNFGIRSIQVDPHHGLRINGDPVKLRGACVHSDHGPLGVAAFARAEQRKAERLKAAGFNAIRSAHNPASNAFLDACDRVGLLVMDELFDMWTSSKSASDNAFDFAEWWERDVEALVAKDVNHPSVVFYSIGNEIPEAGNPAGARWGRRIAEKIRSLDDTRLITNGVNGFVALLDVVIPAMQARREGASDVGGVNTMMNDVSGMMALIQASDQVTERTEESFAVLDVAGMNYGDARYELDRERFPNRVIVGTETFPTKIAANWPMVMSSPHVIGDFTWTGWDYLGEVGIGATRYLDGATGSSSLNLLYPALTAWCGDIDITGRRRPISYYREIVFGLRDAPYLAVFRPESYGRATTAAGMWAWSDTIDSWTWEGFEGKPIEVEVYSRSEEVELRLNDLVVGRSAIGDKAPFLVTFDLIYEPGELTAVGYSSGVETGRASLRSATAPLVLVATADREELSADGSDLAFIDLVLTDGAGAVHTGRDRSVTVAIEGPAVRQAMGSANPVTEETFATPHHMTYDGRALAIVRPTGPGQIIVTATADDCEPASVTLTSTR